MNLLVEISKMRDEGYTEANAQARVCQDIILDGIARGNLSQNVTIKGGVVMRNLSGNVRRATQDIDLDFIRYSLSDAAIERFIEQLEPENGIDIEIKHPILELNHRDYKGKRVFVVIKDEAGNSFESKIDIGVHNNMDVRQEEYCFDICFQEDRVSLLMNSREQIIVEKLKSFLRFGARSTRYKDVFDICYLSECADKERLKGYINEYIYKDPSLPVNNIDDVIARIERVFRNTSFINSIEKSKKNWLEISVEEALQRNIDFIRSLLQ